MVQSDSFANNPVGLPRFGLYFPYIHFRDDNWVKVAALYWPKMARIVPVGYPTRDSDTVRALIDHLNWTVDVQPEEARDLVIPDFEDFVAELKTNDWWPGVSSDEVETEISSAPHWGAGPGMGPIWGARFDHRLAGMYSTEFEPGLRNRLIELGLACPARVGASDDQAKRTLDSIHSDRYGSFYFHRYRDSYSDRYLGSQQSEDSEWLIMHRDLAWIYKCLLSETLASHNRLALTTDQVDAHAAASGLSLRQLALGGVAREAISGDLVTTFGLMAIQTVVPKDVVDVPVDKIIMIRERYGDEFDLWRDYIDRVGADLAEQLVNVESPHVLRRYLDEAARKYAEAPVNRLRQGLASVGVDTVSAALNTKFETPAAIAATGLVTGNPVAVAAGAAVGIAELRRSTKGKARTQLASPNSYLLNVQESLTPRSWIKRIMASMRAAAGLRG